ncbi:hypothetical protein V8E55_002418 [Tylopilus felleus]
MHALSRQCHVLASPWWPDELTVTAVQSVSRERTIISFSTEVSNSLVYNAREVLRPKSAMETMSPLEYRTKDKSDTKWGQRAQLEMLAISLLHRPAHTEKTEDADESDINDLRI